LLDLDYLGWAGTGTGDRAVEAGLMLQNLAPVAANYRKAGIRFFVLAYFARSTGNTGRAGGTGPADAGSCARRFRCRTSSGGWPAM
jgi:hypothetical protein